ncbi:hypothetical protein JCM3766R1_002480 [Sporobolomyces carnicolor]
MQGQPFLPPSERRVYPIPELHPLELGPPALGSYSAAYNASSSSSAPPALCIDNGATQIRAGFSDRDRPYLELDNVGAKYRDRKLNTTVNLAGGEVYVDAASRSSVRVPYEGDVVCNFDVMENILDYVLIKLGIDTETVQTPIVMTESLCNPAYSRSLMTEILFESYGAPSVAYGLDSLFSFYDNNHAQSSKCDGLIISSATSSTQVIPVLDGKSILTAAKKITWGGYQASEYLLKLMQLKYPAFPGRLSSYQSGIMYRDHCYNSVPDYQTSITSIAKDPKNLVAIDRIIQFPFTSTSVAEEKSEEEMQKQLEKRKEATRRLQEQAAKQRTEKIERQQEELAVFGELKASQSTLKKIDYDKKLKEYGFSSPADLDEYLKKIEKSLTRAKNKELGIDETENKEPPTFPLIDVPDHTLNEEDLKEKRKQKLMKAGYDARIRMKLEKEQERLRLEQVELADRQLRENDFERWLTNLRNEHRGVMDKIKERKKRKEQLSDRKSLAAQNRMKSIAGLAADESKGVGTGGGGSIGGAGNKRRKKVTEDDGFGKSDADWAVYREIGNADDSEDEEDEWTNLKEVEARLLEHDPDFTVDDTAERLAMRSHQLFNAFVYGLAPDDPLDTYDASNVEHTTQLHVNVERVRVPEVLWQPHLGGLDQAGLGETVEYVLKGFGPSERERLMSNIFVTGGNTLLPNFDARLRSSLTPVLPVGHPLSITRTYESEHPSWSAWRGMTKWSRSPEATRAFVTRQEYEEHGADWFKEHAWGNRHIA